MLTLEAPRKFHLEKETFARQRGSTPLRLLWLLVLSAAVVVGCEQMRKDTYPGDFVYLSKNAVTLLGDVGSAIDAGRELNRGPVAVQVKNVKEAEFAVDRLHLVSWFGPNDGGASPP